MSKFFILLINLIVSSSIGIVFYKSSIYVKVLPKMEEQKQQGDRVKERISKIDENLVNAVFHDGVGYTQLLAELKKWEEQHQNSEISDQTRKAEEDILRHNESWVRRIESDPDFQQVFYEWLRKDPKINKLLSESPKVSQDYRPVSLEVQSREINFCSIAALQLFRQYVEKKIFHRLYVSILLGVGIFVVFLFLWSIGKEHVEVVQLVEEEEAKASPFSMLVVAAKYGNIKNAQEALAKGANIHATYPEYSDATALLVASERGHANMVKLLLEAKADVNATNKDGTTALMLASWNRHIEVVKLLLEAKADVHAKNKEGKTALSRTSKEIMNLIKAAEAKS